MKNKKGFTLIELLAVIVILGIILAIAGTSIINAINSSKKAAKYAAAKEIVEMAEAYLAENPYKADGSENKIVTVEDLCKDGYLEDDATNPKTGKNDLCKKNDTGEYIDGKISVYMDNSFSESNELINYNNDKYKGYYFDGFGIIVVTSDNKSIPDDLSETDFIINKDSSQFENGSSIKVDRKNCLLFV